MLTSAFRSSVVPQVILFLILIVIYKCTDGLIKLHGKERQRRRLLASRPLHKVASATLELSSGGSDKRRPGNTWQKVVRSSPETTASLLEQPGSPPTAGDVAISDSLPLVFATGDVLSSRRSGRLVTFFHHSGKAERVWRSVRK